MTASRSWRRNPAKPLTLRCDQQLVRTGHRSARPRLSRRGPDVAVHTEHPRGPPARSTVPAEPPTDCAIPVRGTAKASGDVAAARRLAAMRRPSLAAWAGNLLVKDQADQVRQFQELGEALRAAHRDLDRATMRALSAAQGRVISALVEEAARLARQAGHRLSDVVRQEVTSTLRALLADPAASEQWATGWLTTALTPPTDFTSAIASHKPRPAPAATPAPRRREAAARRQHEQRLQRARDKGGAPQRRRKSAARSWRPQQRHSSRWAQSRSSPSSRSLRRNANYGKCGALRKPPTGSIRTRLSPEKMLGRRSARPNVRGTRRSATLSSWPHPARRVPVRPAAEYAAAGRMGPGPGVYRWDRTMRSSAEGGTRAPPRISRFTDEGPGSGRMQRMPSANPACTECGEPLEYEGDRFVCGNGSCAGLGMMIPVWSALKDAGLAAPAVMGLPRPVHGGLPVPWVAPRTRVQAWWRPLDAERMAAAHNEWRCQVCGVGLPEFA